jgi:pimeloyl-ACP methyl ester carboxylesterase
MLDEPALAGPYQLIHYHRRGFSGSSHVPPPVTIADHAADAAALLGCLGVSRAHIVGHSSGAAVAFELALNFPALVQTVASLELSLLSVPKGAAFFEEAGPALRAYTSGNHEGALAAFLSLISGLPWDECRRLLDERIPGMIASAVRDIRTFFEIELPSLGAWTFGAREAARVTQSVLSVIGSQTGALWLEVAQLLRESAPHTEECTIDGVGHLLHIQRPQPVARSLAAFFSRNQVERP